MKNAEDYVEETSPNNRRITSLAYWLTPEGLDSSIIAALLRESISDMTDEEFKEVFDGATKEEATKYLEQWELCYMAHWGAPELARAIVLSDVGRNEALALRTISLAQNTNELSEVFPPQLGLKWAMARGYLIERSLCAWVGVPSGNYGHPSNPLSTVDTPVPERTPISKQQETEILSWLTSNNYDPLKLPIAPSGKAGVKSECRKVLLMSPTALFSSIKTFDTAWQRLRDNGAIKDAEKYQTPSYMTPP